VLVPRGIEAEPSSTPSSTVLTPVPLDERSRNWKAWVEAL
jgi:hypothetical protein